MLKWLYSFEPLIWGITQTRGHLSVNCTWLCFSCSYNSFVRPCFHVGESSGPNSFWTSLVAQMVKNLPEMQEAWVDPLEKGMATHSSILAWRIPWTEEPGGLQSMGHIESDTTEWLTLSLSSLFWHQGQSHGRQFSHRLGVGVVSGWFKHVTLTVCSISIIITSVPPHIIRHWILEVGDPCVMAPAVSQEPWVPLAHTCHGVRLPVHSWHQPPSLART